MLGVPDSLHPPPPRRQPLRRLGSERRCHPRGAALNARAGPLPSPRAAHNTSAQVQLERLQGPWQGQRAADQASAGRRHNEGCLERKPETLGTRGAVQAAGGTPTPRPPGASRSSASELRTGRGVGGRRRRPRDRDATAERCGVWAGPVGGGGAAPAGTLASRVHVQAAAGVAGAVVAERAALGVARRAHTSQRNRLRRRGIT